MEKATGSLRALSASVLLYLLVLIGHIVGNLPSMSSI
jgi:hypothetical protein